MSDHLDDWYRGVGKPAPRFVLAGTICIGLLAVISAGRPVFAPPVTPTPHAMASPPSQAMTPLPASAGQAENGAHLYVLICQDCHGDQGQGLTDAWRATWDPRDQNCWQSKCHATNHPPEGFVLPRYIPPVVGPAVVTRFATAADLHAFIKQKMPWYAPGSLTEDDYWQLTAYLMQANDVNLQGKTLDSATAYQIQLRPATQIVAQAAAQTSGMNWGVPLAGATIAGLCALALLWRRRRTIDH